jgi:hypothetical protein
MPNENGGRKIIVDKKMDETPFFVETMLNKYNNERQIQVNDTYADKKDDGKIKYGRRGVNINIIDMPAVVAAIAELYQEETGKKLEI